MREFTEQELVRREKRIAWGWYTCRSGRKNNDQKR